MCTAGVCKIGFCSAMLPVTKTQQPWQQLSSVQYCMGTAFHRWDTLQGMGAYFFKFAQAALSAFTRINRGFLCLRKSATKDKEAWSFDRREQLSIRGDLEYLSEIAWWEAYVSILVPVFICLFAERRDIIYFVKRKKTSNLWALGLSAGKFTSV